MNVPFRLK